MKTCTRCSTNKPFEAFHKDKTRADGFRSCCKACVSSYMANYYAKDPARVITKAQVWVEKNRERHNAKCAKWAKDNPAKVNARTARRYASKTQATPVWLDADQLWMIAEAYALAKLRTQILGVPHEVDHIVPLRGRKIMGLHVPWNLQVIPKGENRRKSNNYAVT